MFEQMVLCIYICFLKFFLWCVSFCFILFYYYPFEAYLFPNERQRGDGSRWEWRGTESSKESNRVVK